MRWLVLAAWVATLAGPPARAAGWDGFQVLMWQERTAAQWRGLAALGFTGGKVRGTGGVVDEAGLGVLRGAGVGFYVENVATDFYAAYHRWTAEHPVTWLFDEARAAHRTDREGAFVRVPSLSDAAWLARVGARGEGVARAAPGALFYDLADEGGIADLAAAWDFDRGPEALAAFRAWLRGRYGTVAALDAEWGTGFGDWDAVVPATTDAAVGQAGENFSPWFDFKDWMDGAYAAAVRAGAEGIRRGGGMAGLEGGQVPGWGGYDYARLAPAVDVMEVYEFGDAPDLALAFNPALRLLRTSYGRGPREAHAAWRSLLHGGRGMIVWDEGDDVVGADGAALARGRELGGLIGRLKATAPLLGAPSPDAVAVLVSQGSFRMQWLLDRRAGDHDWAARDAEREYDDNRWRASRRVMLRHLAALGVEPVLVSSEMLERGALGGAKVLLLADAVALSDAEVAAIGAFRAGGGTVLADTEAGVFDGHGRRRTAAIEVAHPAAVRDQGGGDDPAQLAALAALLRKAGVAPRVEILAPGGGLATGVEARWFDGGRVLSVQAAEPWGAPPRVTLRFAGAVAVTDLRAGVGRPEAAAIEVALDGIEPLVLRLGR